ncbi:MAG: class II aldolase/adducin family protein [Micromonosporaceae bacterium]
MLIPEARAEVVRYAQRLVPDGLVVSTSGNISVRDGDLVAVTPSGLEYDQLTPELVCVCDLDGEQAEGPLKPTSEMPMHLAVYRRTGHTAVVHTHSTAATAVSTLVDELPAIHYLMALFGGPVRVTGYARFGTQQLADTMIKALDGRQGCILGNHGTVTVAGDLHQAYTRNLYLEWLCEVWLRTQAVGSPRVLPVAEITEVARQIAGYGQKTPEAP